MKKFLTSITLAAAAMVALSAGASEKRGIGVNSYSIAEMEMLLPQVSWYYNWGNASSLPTHESVDFVPMCWSNYNADAIRKHVKEHPETKYLLGFNEPNFKDQANMTPSVAAEKWPAVQALAKELGLKLVSPALNYSPDAPYQDPLKWMDEFVGLVGKDAFDATAIHCYGGEGTTKNLATQFHDRYGKPVWVTEFNHWPGNSGNGIAVETQMTMMNNTVKWMEQTEWIERYAWFMLKASSDWKKYNFHLVEIQGTIGNAQTVLTPLGKLYANMGTFDKNKYYAPNEWVNVSECTDCDGVQFGPFAGETGMNNPLATTKFAANNWLEYNFEAGQAGTYYLQLRFSGYGEPKRYDPQFAISVDGTEVTPAAAFSLPNSDTEVAAKAWPVTLSAGKHTIRITEKGKGSGIVLIAANLSTDAAISSVAADSNSNDKVEYFNLQGVKVANPVAGGLYIRRQGSEVSKIRF